MARYAHARTVRRKHTRRGARGRSTRSSQLPRELLATYRKKPNRAMPALAAKLTDGTTPVVQRQQLARQIGRVHGNQYLQRVIALSRVGQFAPQQRPSGSLVQRGIMDALKVGIGGGLGGLFDLRDPLAPIFDKVVKTNTAKAQPITIPSKWVQVLLMYIKETKEKGDRSKLMAALLRGPRFWRGGWIMKLQKDAAAMTLDTSIFVSGQLTLDTYAHELLHVYQYGVLGKTNFLKSYFGMSAATILKRFLKGEPLKVMRSSPHEEQAYRLEERFEKWHVKRFGKSAGGFAV